MEKYDPEMPTQTPNTILGQGIGRIGGGQPIQPKKDITIVELLNGFIVIVGCQSVVFETQEKLILELGRYLTNRKDVEKEYLSKNKN